MPPTSIPTQDFTPELPASSAGTASPTPKSFVGVGGYQIVNIVNTETDGHASIFVSVTHLKYVLCL